MIEKGIYDTYSSYFYTNDEAFLPAYCTNNICNDDMLERNHIEIDKGKSLLICFADDTKNKRKEGCNRNI